MRLPSFVSLCIFIGFFSLSLAAQNFAAHSYPAHGEVMLTADFNRDGHTDILEIGSINRLGLPAFLRMNDGQGGFPSSIQVDSAPVTAATIADLNGDGYPDIAACVVTSGPNIIPLKFAMNVYLNQHGTGKFTLAQSFALPDTNQCVGVASGDVNHDGFTDVVVGLGPSAAGPGTLITFMGSKTGTLQPGIQQVVAVPSVTEPQSTCSLRGLTAADFSSSGRYDLVLFGECTVVVGTGTLYYAKSTANGTYTLTEITEVNGNPLLDADEQISMHPVNLNGDLAPDVILVTSHFDRPGVYSGTIIAMGNGAGQFQIHTAFSESDGGDCGNGIAGADVADFNGDGHPDIVNSAAVPPNGCGSSVLPGFVIVDGNSQGTWTVAQETDLPRGTATPQQNSDVVTADFNNDNRPDFAMLARNSIDGTTSLLLFTNLGTNPVSGCKPSGAGAHLCTPISGGHTLEHFNAAATGITGPVRLMQLYIDGKKAAQFAGSQISATLKLPTGTHTAQAVELEFNGNFSKSSILKFLVK